MALRLASPLARTKRTAPLAGTERTGQSGRGLAFGAPVTDSPSLREGSRATGAGRPNGQGGARGKYSSVDGDLLGAAEYLPGPAKFPDLAVEFLDLPGAAGYAQGLVPDTRLANLYIMHVNSHGVRSHMAKFIAAIRLSTTPPDVVTLYA